MEATYVCPECEMEFDWQGVEVDGEIYCCEACSVGEPCTCPQHSQDIVDTTMPTTIGTPGPI
jgi:hypothetical protein